MNERDQLKPPNAFELIIQVEPPDIDQLGHVNNVTYVRWIQEVAAAHWNATAAEEDKQKLLWVVLRHEIDYKQAAFDGEILTARTWVGDAKKLRFERHTEFIRNSDGRSLVKARTVWCPVDASSGRPVEVSAQIRASFSNSGEITTDATRK